MTAVATVIELADEDRFVAEFVAHGHNIAVRASSASEFLTGIDATVFSLVVVTARRRFLTALLVDACDSRGVRLIAVARDSHEQAYASSLGIFDIIDATAPWDVIEKTMLGTIIDRTHPHTKPETKKEKAQIIAVWGPIGSPGTTMIAINIAAELAAEGRKVVLIDVDTYGASVASALGLLDEAPGLAAACRLAGTDSLSLTELERVASRYESPAAFFWVLTGITRPSRWPELTPDKIEKTLRACRDWVDVVVVDVGFNFESDEEISSDLFAPRRNAATRTTLGVADKIIAVGAPDPVSLPRFLRAYTDLKELTPDVPISVVINRVRTSVVGTAANAQVRSTLRRFGGIERAVVIPNDQRGVDAALIAGRSLRDSAPRSPVSTTIRGFVASELLLTQGTVSNRRPRGKRKR
jgi:Flp pilus assembly CpaE family ATPase